MRKKGNSKWTVEWHCPTAALARQSSVNRHTTNQPTTVVKYLQIPYQKKYHLFSFDFWVIKFTVTRFRGQRPWCSQGTLCFLFSTSLWLVAKTYQVDRDNGAWCVKCAYYPGEVRLSWAGDCTSLLTKLGDAVGFGDTILHVYCKDANKYSIGRKGKYIYIYTVQYEAYISTLTLHFDMHWSQNTVLYNDWRIKRLTLLGTYTHFIHTSYVLFPRVSHQRVLQCLAEPAMKEVKHRQSVAKQERKRPGHRQFGRKLGRSQQLVFGWEIYRWGDDCICTPSTCNWVSVCIERFVADKVVAKHGSCQKAWTL